MPGTNNNKISNVALPAGYRFSEFEVKEVIGGGGFGIVYRAWDHQLERMIAIKEYLPVSMAVRNEDMTLGLRSERFEEIFQAGLNSFINEARLLANFNHPCLLHVLRFWQKNGTAYMATLLYSGQTLKALHQTAAESINEHFIRQLLPPLFSALKTLHSAGYLHRDISLDNIQIQDNQLPVLLDFGSARKEIGNLSDKTEIMLKPGYAPIEQYTEDSEGEQGPWTDIYALGAVLYTLVVGEAPPVSVVRSIEDNLQPLADRRPAGYSLTLLAAIDRALSLSPADRPQTVDALAALMALPISTTRDVLDALQPILPTETPSEETTTLQAMAMPDDNTANPRRLKRFRLPLLAAALVLVLLAAWLIHTPSRSPSPIATATPDAPKATQEVHWAKAPSNPPQTNTGTAVPPSSTSAAPAQTPPREAVAVANVYLQLSDNDQLLLDDKPQTVAPAKGGQRVLMLPAGQHQILIERQGKKYRQNLTIDRPGTWLITPALVAP